jgi:hypothetical protein
VAQERLDPQTLTELILEGRIQARGDSLVDAARALYGSRLRPTSLDEVRARVLAGDPPPANASRELRELAELRAGVTGEDAAGRRLLAGLAQQVGAQALLVVRLERSVAAPAPAAAPSAPPSALGSADEPAIPVGSRAEVESAADGGAAVAAGNGASTVARLFLAGTGDFDAARYQPEAGLTGAAAWASTVASLESRFPASYRTVGPTAATAPGPVKARREGEKSAPFYASAWFWGALGGAALLGGAFYFATQDTTSEPIHLQMRLPR